MLTEHTLLFLGLKLKSLAACTAMQSKQMRGNTNMPDYAQHLLTDNIIVQGQAAQFMRPDEPFRYLGVLVTMDLNWSHQINTMTHKLSHKLERLNKSQASPKQVLDILRTVVIPSIAYAFPVTPCSPTDLHNWDSQILALVKSKYGLWDKTGTALLHEDKLNFGLGCPSMTIEYHYRNTVALVISLNDNTKHGRITNLLLNHQSARLENAASGA